MRIERLRIAGFGRLRGEIVFDSGRCSLIVAPNEAGKSTLVAALVSALYDLPSERRSKHNPITVRDAFAPWEGGAYGLEIDFRLGGDGYTLLRDFSTDRVELREARTGKDLADRFRAKGGRYEILEQLLGLERDDFTRSALVMQDEIHAIRESGDITLRLQKFATSRGSDITAGEAVECLEDALTRYTGTQLAGHGKVETELHRLRERIAAVRHRLEALERLHAGAAEELEQLTSLGSQEAELTGEVHRLEYLRARAIVSEIQEQIADQERAVEEEQVLAAERDRLAAGRDFPLEARSELSKLKGNADELAARIAEADAALQAEVKDPLSEVRERLGALDALRTLAPDDGQRLETLAVRLGDLQDRLRDAHQAIRRERRRLRRAGIDVEDGFRLRERFRALDPDDTRFLGNYRERVLEMEAQGRDPGGPSFDRPTAQFGVGRAVPLSLGAGLALGGTLLWALLDQALVGGALLAVGLALVAFEMLARGPRRAFVLPSAPHGLADEAAALRDRGARLAEQLRFADADALVAEFRRWEEIHRDQAEFGGLEDEGSRAQDDLSKAQQEAAELLGRAGQELDPVKVRRRDVEALRNDVRKRERLQERERELTRRARREIKEIHGLEERLIGINTRIREILRRGGIEPSDPADEEVLRRFEEAAERAQRYHQLEDELLPAATAKVAAPDWLEGRRAGERRMEEFLTEILKRRPLDPPPEPEHSSNHYVVDLKRAEDNLQRVQRQRREVFGRAGDVLRRYREEGPVLVAQLEELEASRRRADRFRRAVRIAADRLSEISRESYEEWATALNERANRSLVHLNPSYRDLRFDTDLSFTLEEVATGRRLGRDEVDAHLSVGARDQIYLAIRLAVSDYFSAGRFRLPLVLDDPLAAADDERFDRSMVFLTERVSARQQVILLSCQEERYQRFRERHPDLYDARVNTMDLPTIEAKQAR